MLRVLSGSFDTAHPAYIGISVYTGLYETSTLTKGRVVNCFLLFFFFFQAEDGIRDLIVTGVQTCALPIYSVPGHPGARSGGPREAPARRRAARGAHHRAARPRRRPAAPPRPGAPRVPRQDRKSVV